MPQCRASPAASSPTSAITPVTRWLAGALYTLYGKNEHMERIWEILDKIEGIEQRLA
jgi:hypothetical protein